MAGSNSTRAVLARFVSKIELGYNQARIYYTFPLEAIDPKAMTLARGTRAQLRRCFCLCYNPANDETCCPVDSALLICGGVRDLGTANCNPCLPDDIPIRNAGGLGHISPSHPDRHADAHRRHAHARGSTCAAGLAPVMICSACSTPGRKSRLSVEIAKGSGIRLFILLPRRDMPG